MFKAVSALNNMLGAIISLIILGLLAIGGWLGARTFVFDKWTRETLESTVSEQKVEIEKLSRNLETQRLEIQRLETALKLLKVDHRVAQIDVLKQSRDESGELVTTFSFVEVDAQGKPLYAPRIFTIKGDKVYIDARVVKFTDESVEEAEPFRSTSLALFNRVFGEYQQPSDGFALDPPGSQPIAYRTAGEPSEFEKEIWERFWEYSNNPEEAHKKGIRAAHGEAPSQKLVPGKRYKLELRSSGGLSFQPEDLPKDAAKPAF